MRRIPGWLRDLPNGRFLPAAAALGALALAAVIALFVASPWSSGDDNPEGVSGSPARSPIARRTSSPSTAPSTPAVTEAPAPPADTPAPQPPAGPPGARLAPLLSWNGSDPRVVELAMVPGSGDEAFLVTQQEARIWRVSLSGAFAPALAGDLSDRVGTLGNEEGLLSLAFSPEFQSDGRVYVYYTRGAPQPTVLSRFQVSGGTIDTANETVILDVPDFASNHNGGRIVFGPDGYLYLSTGDGGGGSDPQENGQNTNTLLGKVLRLDVTGHDRYAIPADNPFAGGGAPEVWAYGFRNPWRMSIDRATGEFWVGDVGQGSWEEVGRVVRGGNHGWDCYEGFAVYEPDGCPAAGFVPPRATYSLQGEECAVSGGFVYRGTAIGSLQGWYVYADFCSGKIWAVNPSDDSPPVLLADTEYFIPSFAELPGGELAVLTFNNAIYKLVP